MPHQFQSSSLLRFSLGLFVVLPRPLQAALSLTGTAKLPKLSLAVHKRSGVQIAKWATRCIKRHAGALDAELVAPRHFQKKGQHTRSSGVYTVLFVREPVDLAVSHFVNTRSTSTEDDYILPGTAREVQEEVSKTLKSNVTKWMEVDKRESYQNWLLRVNEPTAFRAHLAHLLPEVQSMEEAIKLCNSVSKFCKKVSLDTLRKSDEAYMSTWEKLLSIAGTDLTSANEEKLKECLAQKAPTAFKRANATATLLEQKRPVRSRRGRLHPPKPLTTQEMTQLTQVAASVDKALYGGRFARVGKRLVATRV